MHFALNFVALIAEIKRLHIFLYIGINIFLDGFVPTENLRFREASLTFKVAETALEEEIKRMCRYEYPDMRKLMGTFI
jgi:translation initiation factor RLI1